MTEQSYICPHCQEPQTDAWVVHAYSFVDPDNGTRCFHCPNCDGQLNEDQTNRLLDAADEISYRCPHCQRAQSSIWIPEGTALARCPDCHEITEA